MAPSLEEVKHQVRQSFLGKGGIHAVGVSRAKQAIRVYVSPGPEADQPAVLDEVRKAAEPFSVIVVTEDRPRLG
jgi:hypothetical protein